ncbi:MAG: type IV pilus twitching motility protein PilT [Planctomycetota bacterium]
MDLDKLLDVTIDNDATDFHLRVGVPPKIRIQGSLRNVGSQLLTPEDTLSMAKSIMSDKQMQEIDTYGSTDFGLSYQDKARFRVSVFRQRGRIGVVMRTIPNRHYTFEELGLPPVVRELCLRPRGLFLVTGPTGSGKTTTLASMLDFINDNPPNHIITIEDPIEYIHPHKKCIVTQIELGNDTPSFAEAIRRGLRQDPDIFLVGEMRDLDTMAAAVTAAETGHLVFATLHTTGAGPTVNRIVDGFPINQQEQVRTQLAANLVAILSQQLIPVKEGGRTAVFELMIINPAIQHLIRKNETFKLNSIIQTSSDEGMILLDDFLFNLFCSGRVSLNDVLIRAQFPNSLEKKLREFRATLEKSKSRV